MIAILVILVIVAVSLRRSRKKREFIYEVSARDQRLAELDARIANPEYTRRTGPGATRRYPYETSYFSAAQVHRQFGTSYIGILVETEMRRERFYTDISSPIEVGRDASCAITVLDDKLAPRQFVIERKGSELEVRKLEADSTMFLERGDAYHRIGDKAVILENHDVILAGKSSFSITVG